MLIELYEEIPFNLLILSLVLCALSGWFLDNAMRANGAGFIGNSLLLGGGAVAGFIIAAYVGVDLKKEVLEGLAYAFGGGVWLLMVACFIKSRVTL